VPWRAIVLPGNFERASGNKTQMTCVRKN